ncbi:MAG: hypothetical protein LQ340_007925 [Diploschistes diacapsis]|nr:MAG: hypothetical protein LQ340_007925 [Diploschistes diacapsis]
MARSTDSNPSSSDGEASASDAPNHPKEIKSSLPEISPTQSDAPSESSSIDRGRHARPKLGGRNSSTMIVPRSRANEEDAEQDFPPGDARAMSPRRNSEETEAMEEATRSVVRGHARQVQLSLLEIAESIEMVKQDHDKLEKQNAALQDYIGGLTRSMSKGQGGKSGKK